MMILTDIIYLHFIQQDIQQRKNELVQEETVTKKVLYGIILYHNQLMTLIDLQRYYQLEQEDQDYYYDYYNQRQRGVRSASPQIRKERKRRQHHNRTSWLNKANVPFQPMMNPMIHYQQQQILGACATDPLFMNGSMPTMPQPMIQQQPYLLQTNAFGTGFQHQQPFYPNFFYPLMNDLINNVQSNNTNESIITNNNDTSAAEVVQKESEVPEPTTTNEPTPRAPIRRRRSMIETVLSSFSSNNNNNNSNILHKSWEPSSYVSLDEALGNNGKDTAKAIDSLSPPSSFSNITATTDESTAAKQSTSSSPNRPTLSRKTSLKLAQKASALQMRQYIWCYKLQNTEAALWAAFDVKNQAKLDKHYAYLLSKRQQLIQQQQQQAQADTNDEEVTALPGLPNEVLSLKRQSQLNGLVMVSLSTGTAWCLDNDSSFSFGSNGSGQILLDVACLPRQDNQFVVSNEYMTAEAKKERVIRRSKSVDGLATKLLNTVLKW